MLLLWRIWWSNSAHPGLIGRRADGYVALVAVGETGLTAAGVVEAVGYDDFFRHDGSEVDLVIVSIGSCNLSGREVVQ